MHIWACHGMPWHAMACHGMPMGPYGPMGPWGPWAHIGGIVKSLSFCDYK